MIREEDGNKFLVLTTKGHDIVHEIISSRTLFFYFFKYILNVDEQTAYDDSCQIEHLISHDSAERLFNFIKSYRSENQLTSLDQLDLNSFDHFSDFTKSHKATFSFEKNKDFNE